MPRSCGYGTPVIPCCWSSATDERGPVGDIRLGPRRAVLATIPQYLVQAGEWQAAAPLPGQAGYTLVSCVVSPGFEFSGFSLAPDGWRPGS